MKRVFDYPIDQPCATCTGKVQVLILGGPRNPNITKGIIIGDLFYHVNCLPAQTHRGEKS